VCTTSCDSSRPLGRLLNLITSIKACERTKLFGYYFLFFLRVLYLSLIRVSIAPRPQIILPPDAFESIIRSGSFKIPRRSISSTASINAVGLGGTISVYPTNYADYTYSTANNRKFDNHFYACVTRSTDTIFSFIPIQIWDVETSIISYQRPFCLLRVFRTNFEPGPVTLLFLFIIYSLIYFKSHRVDLFNDLNETEWVHDISIKINYIIYMLLLGRPRLESDDHYIIVGFSPYCVYTNAKRVYAWLLQ
jgi:hypothetical protein